MSFVAALAMVADMAADAGPPPICTDRPAKGNAVCSVPAGGWQLESSIASWSLTRSSGVRTSTYAIGATVLKTGLSERSDLQIGFTPYVHARTKADGSSAKASATGDLTIRYKRRLTAANARIQVGVIPSIKLPTASKSMGNGKLEGGLAIPVAIATGSPVTVVLGPEVNLLADADGSGRHLALINVLNLSAPVFPNITLIGEAWTMTNFDPAHKMTLASADMALSWLVHDDLQLDAGANFGLNRDTADVEIYSGLSIRF